MVRTDAWRFPYFRSSGALAALALHLTLALDARAEPHLVSIVYAEPELREFADRLASELASDGYAIEFGSPEQASPCEPASKRGVFNSTRETAWIRVSRSATDGDAIEASICYLSAVPLLQRASAATARSEPGRFALATAEALNGLRANVPLLSPGVSSHTQPRSEPALTRRAHVPRADSALAAGPTLIMDSAGFPPMWGVELGSSVPIVPAFGLAFDTFWPIASSKLANSEVKLAARSAWVRIGPEADLNLGPTSVHCSLLAGPAITWATATAFAPRVGNADVALSAILSLGSMLEFPRAAPMFVFAAGRISGLFPGVRVQLGADGSHTFGRSLIEASLGFGLRWSIAAE